MVRRVAITKEIVRKSTTPNERIIDDDIQNRLKGNQFSYIMMPPTGSIKRSSRRKVKNPSGRIIDDDIQKRLKGNHDYIQMVGRPVGSTKDPNRRKVTNPNGRLIDYNGLQYNKLIKRGYKLNNVGTHLVRDGDIVKKIDSQKIKNPETGRLIKKNAYTYKQLIKKYSYDDDKNEFIISVFDPKLKHDISIGSPEFKKRIEHGYIYDKLNI